MPASELVKLHWARTSAKSGGEMDETIPSEKSGGQMDEILPSEKSGGQMDEILPSEKSGGQMDETIPSDKTGGQMDQIVPSDKSGGAVGIFGRTVIKNFDSPRDAVVTSRPDGHPWYRPRPAARNGKDQLR